MMNQNYGSTGSGSRSSCHRCGGGCGLAGGRSPIGAQNHYGNACPLPREARSGGCGCGLNRGRSIPAQSREVDCGCGANNRQGNVGRMGRLDCHDHNDHHDHNGHNGHPDGCNGQKEACKRLLEQIRAVDFALWETVLYLDVYPHSCDALETYHKLKAQSEALRREYEKACGPMTATGNQSTTSWDWMNQPFPWEYDAD